MGKKDDDFQKKLLETFKLEAEEHLKAISAGLLELEKAPGTGETTDIIEAVFREAHSLKGAARAVGMTDIERICQSMESVFSAFKRREISPTSGMFDVLYGAVDTVDKLVSSCSVDRTSDEQSRIAPLISQIDLVLKGETFPSQPARNKAIEEKEEEKIKSRVTSESGKSASTETVRIAIAKLDSLFLEAEELLGAKLTATQRAAEIREITAALTLWKEEWARIDVDMRSVQHSLQQNGGRNGQPSANRPVEKVLEFLVRGKGLVRSLEDKLVDLLTTVEHDRTSLGAMVDNLLGDMKKVLVLPCVSLLEIFPKFVRDLSRDRAKEAETVTRGGEIEVDRRILEEMKDPLMHLVRNCIDHGIEKPEERERMNKSRRGTVTIAVAQIDSSKVEILVSDDGAGVDVGALRSSALKLGIVSKAEAEKMTDQEVLSLVFRSGVSTSPIITDISGRGLGLAIVREKVEKLGGVLALETHPDIGTTIRVVLPVTLATFRGILVGVGDRRYVIPSANVERVLRVKSDQVKTVENRETIEFDGKAVPLVWLSDALELSRINTGSGLPDNLRAVVLGSAQKRIAFAVDEVLSEQEVLVKGLGMQLSRVRNISGATVLGTGKVVPILNVSDLMKTAVGSSAARMKTPPPPSESRPEKRKSVLVVEDSITARTLLKNILEGAGYDVKTAVDGLDGYTQLRTGEFDIVVSDVDMPRMNGFDLTAKIRSHKELADLPVVLVTALESRPDRERGIDVGANAYVVKSSFDQSNLLEIVKRLV